MNNKKINIKSSLHTYLYFKSTLQKHTELTYAAFIVEMQTGNIMGMKKHLASGLRPLVVQQLRSLCNLCKLKNIQSCSVPVFA